MRKNFAFSVILLAAWVVMWQSTEALTKETRTPPTEDPLMSDVRMVVAGNTEFAFDLYEQLKSHPKIKEDGGNLFFSPYSISTALAMTWAGARSETQKQMAQVLHFSLPQSRLHHAFEELERQLNTVNKKDGYELSVANALWGQKGCGFLDEFLELTEKKYAARLREVDFVTETEKARKLMNRWVEEQTNNKIKELIQPSVLGPLTRLVLTNAIYFRGDWAKPFREGDTVHTAFYVSTDQTEEVAMMCQEENFKYAGLREAQILELPYKEDKLSMVVLLPTKIDGLAGLEESLTAQRLAKYLQNLHSQKVVVYLPKFRMASEVNLAGALETLGMPNAFLPQKADFSGMNGRQDLFISAVLHKAFVDVGEHGTEAAAATAVTMGQTAVPSPLPVFRADHPFLFVIKDRRCHSILFVGRFVNPAKQHD
jgi:serpin B